jgi:tetratricopeptide (TPR) repeat protein
VPVPEWYHHHHRALSLALAIFAGTALCALHAHAAGLSDDRAFALYRQAIAAMEAKDYAAARQHAAAAVAEYPGHLLAHYLLGQAAAAESKWADAAASFAKVAELYPRSFAAHREHGMALERLGRADDAARAWETALAILPDDEEVRGRLAFLLLDQKQPDRALPHLVYLTEHRTAIPAVWSALGRAQYERGDLASAERALSRAAELEDSGRNWFNLGVVRLRLGDRAGALKAFERAAKHAETREPAQREIRALSTVIPPSILREAPTGPPRP